MAPAGPKPLCSASSPSEGSDGGTQGTELGLEPLASSGYGADLGARLGLLSAAGGDLGAGVGLLSGAGDDLEDRLGPLCSACEIAGS